MYRGIKTFQCARCGERFKAPDVEYMASALSMPQACPRCGSLRTRPAGLMGRLADGTYRKVWAEMEKEQKTSGNNP